MKHFVWLGLLIAQVATAEAPYVCRDHAIPREFQSAFDMSRMAPPLPDFLDVERSCIALQHTLQPSLPVPKSTWRDAEAAQAIALLAKSKPDVLVVPVQIQSYGIDRAERMLMTADLAYEIGSRGVKVSDPFLADKAFGEGARRISDADVRHLASAIGAHTIVVSYVGHDLNHSMRLTIVTLDGTARKQQDWPAIGFSDNDPPVEAFHNMVGEAASAAGIPHLGPPHGQKRSAVVVPAALPNGSLKDMTAMHAEQISPSVALALLTSLSESASEYAQERLAERTWLVSTRFDQDGAHANFLRAYALYKLNFRPAALDLVKAQSDDAALTLRELLNGNLPTATAALRKIKNPVDKLILGLSVVDLATYYGADVPTEVVDSLRELIKDRSPSWQWLVANRTRDLDSWHVPDPVELKSLLDVELPVTAFSAKAISTAAELGNETADTDVALTIGTMRHIRALYPQTTNSDCCTRASASANTLDLLSLFEGWNQGGVVKELHRMNSLQARPNDAWKLAGEYEPVFGGHPVITAKRAQAAGAVSRLAQNDTSGSWNARSLENATLAVRMAAGQTSAGDTGLREMGAPSPEANAYLDAYGRDYPRRAFWGSLSQPYTDLDVPHSLFEEALVYSMTALGTALQAAPPPLNTAERDRLVARFDARFLGYPNRSRLLNIKVFGGPAPSPKDVTARLRQEIQDDPDNWDNYYELGKLLVLRDGDYDGAFALFDSFPQFKDRKPRESLKAGNRACKAGRLFFWRGRTELSVKFYEYAASFGSGSSCDFESSASLALLKGDFMEAAGQFLANGQRYSDASAYRDYLQLAHAFGQGDSAWELFGTMSSAFDEPDIWQSALVGLHKDGRDEAYIRSWLLKPENRTAHFRGKTFALRFALMAADVDRTPPKDFRAFLESVEGKPEGKIDADRSATLVPHPQDAASFRSFYPSQFAATKLVPLAENTPVHSRYVLFGDAYASVRLGEYAAAVEKFVALAQRYPIEYDDGSYALPYFARAAAKTGDKVGLRTFIDRLYGNDESFDYWLARAYFSAVGKDANDAELSFRHAFNTRPPTGDRPTETAYEYTEACEWVFNETHDDRFERLLLDSARQYQRVEPALSWPYTMEYAHAKPGPERTRALAIGLYLDPLSPRLKSATAQERAAAKDWLKRNNPFDLKRTKPLRTSIERSSPRYSATTASNESTP